MNKNYLFKIFFIFMFCFSLINCDKDLINNENENIINNETPNDDENQTINEVPNNGNDSFVNDQMYLLKGTIWYADSRSLFIEFPDNHLNLILFRNHQDFGSIGGNLNGNVTLGNFRISSYDGETMKLLDYDKNEIAFNVIIS